MRDVEPVKGSSIGPSAAPVACSGCGGLVDPLRAARVAHIRGRFRYFCSAGCRERFDLTGTETPLPDLVRASSLHPEPSPDEGVDVAPQSDGLGMVESDFLDLEPSPSKLEDGRRPPDEPGDDVAPPVDVGALLLMFAMLGSVLAIALALAGGSDTALTARVIVAVVAFAALAAEQLMGRRDATEPHPASLLVAPVAAALLAVTARLTEHPKTAAAIVLSCVVTLCIAAGIWLMRRARAPIDAERDELMAILEQRGHRIVGEVIAEARAIDLRPGEEIVIQAGETVVADATVTAGTAAVLPWFLAKTQLERREGDTLVAGAQIVSGRLRAVVGWAGLDRAWARLTLDPRRRADLLAPLARFGRLTAERGAPFGAGLAALMTFAANHSTIEIAMAAIAAQAAIANMGIAQIGALAVARTVLDALRRGIAFRSAEALDRAGRVFSAAFCVRGTLLLGEPEVANIEAIGAIEPHEVLALVAGAESGANNPAANAVLRAARARRIRPDAVRSPNVQPGLGVTAIASNGQSLIVGNRALMLKERIGVAVVESKIVDLEAMGRTVLLVALGGRLVGAVALQDGLRPGARAAIQHLLDAGVEPVLLSGDARETCEALGRALDIEHIRPELLPAERGDEVRRLADGGAIVAVVGRSGVDDSALAAADVSVALSSAGSSAAEWSIQLATDDVRAAAYAIRAAHICRSQARVGLILTLASGAAAVLGVSFGLAPSWVAPLAGLAGLLAALFRLRTAA